MGNTTQGGIHVDNRVRATVVAISGFVTWLSVAFGDDFLSWGEIGEGISLLLTLSIGGWAAWQAVPKRVTTVPDDGTERE